MEVRLKERGNVRFFPNFERKTVFVHIFNSDDTVVHLYFETFFNFDETFGDLDCEF